MSGRKRGGARPVGEWFPSLLPKDLPRQRVLIEQYQQFFNGLANDPVLGQVRVLHVGERELALALPGPMQAAWLRQHRKELEQALAEQFGCRLSLKILIDPALMTPARPEPRMPPAQPVSRETAERIAGSARLVGDEALGQALKRLAEVLKKRQPG
jgi:hypothetical protein